VSRFATQNSKRLGWRKRTHHAVYYRGDGSGRCSQDMVQSRVGWWMLLVLVELLSCSELTTGFLWKTHTFSLTDFVVSTNALFPRMSSIKRLGHVDWTQRLKLYSMDCPSEKDSGLQSIETNQRKNHLLPFLPDREESHSFLKSKIVATATTALPQVPRTGYANSWDSTRIFPPVW
jgi:hypothetical protein